MSKRYEHTQVGHMILWPAGAGTLWLLIIGIFLPPRWPSLVGAAVLGLITALFASLHVEVDSEALRLSFGIGWIHKTISLADVESCRAVRNPWYAGWGIRWIVGGWLYNVSGLDAVELQMKNGRRYRVGTDEPQALLEAVRRSLEEP